MKNFGIATRRLAGAASMLGWRPDEFWNATPHELATALGAFAAEDEGPSAELIAALCERFPDER